MLPRKGEHFDYYLDEDLTKICNKKELEEFYSWISGQTCGIIKGQIAFYSWDVERFLDLLRKNKPTFFD